MKNWLAAFALCCVMAAVAPALAADPRESDPSDSDSASELARDGIERLMRALEAFIEMIPQYEMPVINDNGDIIIRRKRDREDPPKDDGDGDLDQTQT